MIRIMLDAAVLAPSASNRQPWRFIVLSDPAIRRQLAEGVKEAVASTAADVLPQYKNDYLSYCRHFLYFEKAPVLIFALFRSEATVTSMFSEDSPSFARVNALELNGAVISVSMAVENLLLAATDQGLGTCVMTGPLIAVGAINHVLSVPEGWSILCMVCAGYAGESPNPVRRKTVEQVLIKSGGRHGAQ